jgi:gas vesicle protein
VKEWIIFLVGALGGSLVGSGATIYTHHHKHRYEKRNRDRDKKQQAYTQFAQFASLYFNQLLLLADVNPILFRIDNGTADYADLEELRRVYKRVMGGYEDLYESTSTAINEISMVAPKHVAEAAKDVFGMSVRLIEQLTRNENDEIEATESMFRKLLLEFRGVARSDLDIQE